MALFTLSIMIPAGIAKSKIGNCLIASTDEIVTGFVAIAMDIKGRNAKDIPSLKLDNVHDDSKYKKLF